MWRADDALPGDGSGSECHRWKTSDRGRQRVHCLEMALAVNVTGGRPVTVADNEFAPTFPRVQLPTAATPAALVVAAPPVTDPAPDTTAKVTDTPDFGLP